MRLAPRPVRLFAWPPISRRGELGTAAGDNQTRSTVASETLWFTFPNHIVVVACVNTRGSRTR